MNTKPVLRFDAVRGVPCTKLVPAHERAKALCMIMNKSHLMYSDLPLLQRLGFTIVTEGDTKSLSADLLANDMLAEVSQIPIVNEGVTNLSTEFSQFIHKANSEVVFC